MSRTLPQVPDSIALADALRASPALASLRERLDRSQRFFALVRPLLPAPLAQHVKPGPVDETAWTLLAANAAVAAKLRQWQPVMEEALRTRGAVPAAIRVRVASAR